MANEATLLIKTGEPINFICADDTGVEKGAIMKLSGAFATAISDGVGDVVAGVAAAEKIKTTGVTHIPVFREGIFKMSLSGSCSVGSLLETAADSANFVKASGTGTTSGSFLLGTALESGSSGNTIRVELKPQGINAG